ncbi:ABC transporter substrate-binding protein [uncultured Corynebacterium sp.]|uniref:ABC transporter substrate-binding protein n=1 Tax=uncultured Corynebacterium sp. TaxID=159447 RepID=UPI0025D422B2|nr:ABC transporter substrate-binding protein [uncultured Corynebacterium sp.]
MHRPTIINPRSRKTSAAIAVAAGAALLLTACSGAGAQGEPGTDSGDAGAGGDAALTVTDVAGRTVSFDERPERVILGEGRAAFVTAMLDKKNPTDKVVAWGGDLHSAAPSFEEKLFEAHPAAKDVPVIGTISKGDVSVENLLAHDPDVIVLTLDHKKAAEENGLLGKLDQAGLKYVFTDFRQKPLENTTASVELLGDVLDEADAAKRFVDMYDAKVSDVRDRAKGLDHKPRTFVWRAAGLKDCCATVNKSNLGDLVNAAGGDNIGDHILDTEFGDLTAEKVIAEAPDEIIATGGSWAADPEKPEILPHVELGYGADPAAAARTLEGVTATPGFEHLTAPKSGDLNGLYHQFYDSPYNVFALQQIAVWLHPEEFSDLDPVAEFEEFHREFLPFELSGTFFTSTGDEDGAGK